MDEKQMPSADLERQTNEASNGEEGRSDRPLTDMTSSGESAQVPEAAAGAPEVTEIDTQQLLEELEQERARAAEYLEQAQRARAEMINYRRRVAQETTELRRYAGDRLIQQFLPVFDDFHRAIQAVPAEERDNPWIQGILLIERKLWSILEAEGVQPIGAVGKLFDPSMHEAVMVEEGVDGADTVVEEFQRGYMLHDRVLRPAMVKVGRGDSAADQPSEQDEH